LRRVKRRMTPSLSHAKPKRIVISRKADQESGKRISLSYPPPCRQFQKIPGKRHVSTKRHISAQYLLIDQRSPNCQYTATMANSSQKNKWLLTNISEMLVFRNKIKALSEWRSYYENVRNYLIRMAKMLRTERACTHALFMALWIWLSFVNSLILD